MSLQKQRKQKDILKVDLVFFSEQEFHAAPMARLADQANVGVSSSYRYFKDKNELIKNLNEETDGALQATIIKGVDQPLSTQLQFQQLITNLINFLKDHPHEFKFLEQYYHSSFGFNKKREKLLIENDSTRRSAACLGLWSDPFFNSRCNDWAD